MYFLIINIKREFLRLISLIDMRRKVIGIFFTCLFLFLRLRLYFKSPSVFRPTYPLHPPSPGPPNDKDCGEHISIYILPLGMLDGLYGIDELNNIYPLPYILAFIFIIQLIMISVPQYTNHRIQIYPCISLYILVYT